MNDETTVARNPLATMVREMCELEMQLQSVKTDIAEYLGMNGAHSANFVRIDWAQLRRVYNNGR